MEKMEKGFWVSDGEEVKEVVVPRNHGESSEESSSESTASWESADDIINEDELTQAAEDACVILALDEDDSTSNLTEPNVKLKPGWFMKAQQRAALQNGNGANSPKVARMSRKPTKVRVQLPAPAPPTRNKKRTKKKVNTMTFCTCRAPQQMVKLKKMLITPLTDPERKTSLGKDWHGACLRCEKCNKTLQPGSHAEHEGKPYCNNPCYSALYGPGGFGRGGAESYVYKK